VLKAATDPGALTLPASEAIWAVNPSQSVWGTAPLESLLSEWLEERRQRGRYLDYTEFTPPEERYPRS